MGYGLFTSSSAPKRQRSTFRPLPMNERETVAVTYFLLRKKVEYFKAKKEGGVKRIVKPSTKKKKITAEEKIAQLEKQEAQMQEKLERLNKEKHEAFSNFRKLLAEEEEEKRRREALENKEKKHVVVPHIHPPPKERMAMLGSSVRPLLMPSEGDLGGIASHPYRPVPPPPPPPTQSGRPMVSYHHQPMFQSYGSPLRPSADLPNPPLPTSSSFASSLAPPPPPPPPPPPSQPGHPLTGLRSDRFPAYPPTISGPPPSTLPSNSSLRNPPPRRKE